MAAGAGSGEAAPASAVVVFTRPGCGACARAKALLASRGVAFGAVDLGAQPGRRPEAAALSGSQLVPQVFVGRRHIGGFDALSALDAGEGGLVEALRWRDTDGEAIAPTRAQDAAAAAALPEAVRAPLARRAEELAGVCYQAGSAPRIRDFLRYAVIQKVAQDQSRNVPLNLSAPPGAAPPPPALPEATAGKLAALLRRMMLHLIDRFAAAAEGTIDYAAMKECAEWALFRAVASELGHPRLRADLLAMSENEKKAFLINLYNAMVFHGVVTFGRGSSLWQLYCFFLAPAVSYSLAGAQVSLDDVENGLLRRQPGYFESPAAARPTSCFEPVVAAAGQGDEAEFKRGLRMAELDARIHMALNCGARGCPATAVYSGASIDPELDEASAVFVADDRNVSAKRTAAGEFEVTFTELFKMYISDFAGEGANAKSADGQLGAIRWALRFAAGEKRELLAAAAEPGAGTLRFSWSPYDWGTNGPDMPMDRHIYSPTF